MSALHCIFDLEYLKPLFVAQSIILFKHCCKCFSIVRIFKGNRIYKTHSHAVNSLYGNQVNLQHC